MSVNKFNWREALVTKVHDNPPYESQWRYKLWVPDFIAEWDILAAWERERFLSMEKELKKGDILFDVGTEMGWQSVIYAQFVGAENMVLIEPNPDYWPTIKAIWEKNFKEMPLNCYTGFLADQTTKINLLAKQTWPKEVLGKLWTDSVRIYRYLHLHKQIPRITIDKFVEKTNIIPKAITIDVEGAELLILQGAEETLKNNKLKVWVSIHPEMLEKNYLGSSPALHEFMASCGYLGEYLATDHEEHWYFHK